MGLKHYFCQQQKLQGVTPPFYGGGPTRDFDIDFKREKLVEIKI